MSQSEGHIERTVGGVFSNALYDALKSMFGGSVVAFGAVLWQYLKHRPVDWWGMVALGAFVGLILGVLTKVRAQQVKPAATSMPKKNIDDSAKAEIDRLRDEIRNLEASHAAELYSFKEFRNQGEAEKRDALDRLDKIQRLFNPLQIETFELRKSIIDWFLTIPECPNLDTTEISADDAERRAKAHCRKVSEWSELIRHGYAIEFQPKVIELAHRLGATGLDVRQLESRSASVGTDEEATEIIFQLGELAVQAEGNE